MEKKIETTIVYGGTYWDNGEKKMEATIVCSFFWDSGKEHGNYYVGFKV